MTTTDFMSIRGQQNYEDDAEINPKEIKIENDKIQNMFKKSHTCEEGRAHLRIEKLEKQIIIKTTVEMGQ